jgi:hypothetical protein
MHPTANQLGCHRELVHNRVECAAGDAARSVLRGDLGYLLFCNTDERRRVHLRWQFQ